jgi:tetratricopeptide (TPR) repeat protein
MTDDTQPEALLADAELGDESHLDGLDQRFLDALEARRRGDIDSASELLRSILRVEPRLAEPRMELSSMLLEAGQIAEAEEEARESLRCLQSGGQWTTDLEGHTLLSLAWNLLGETLRRQADHDDAVFGDPAKWQALMDESAASFLEAARLDPTNLHANHWAFGMGKRKGSKDDRVGGDAADGEDAEE